MKNSRFRPWADLSYDLLELIFGKLDSISDKAHSLLVCKSWRHVVLTSFDPQKQIPFLLVPNEDSVDPSEIQRPGLFSVQKNKKVDNVQLLVPHGKRFCGSCYGWLITNDVTGVTLYNPFSSSKIEFPPVTRTLYEDTPLCVREVGEIPYPYSPHDPRYFEQGDIDIDIGDDDPEQQTEDLESEYNIDHRISKAVLSKDPELYPKDFVLVIIYGFRSRVASIRPGNKNWTYWPEKLEHFSDVIYYDHRFYLVTFKCQLFSCNVEDFPPTIKQIIPPFDMEGFIGKTYLVDLPHRGGLHLLHRVVSWTTVCFDVFKFQQNAGRAKWIVSFNLGNSTIFLGDNSSLAISGSSFSGNYRPNCIYFTDDFYEPNAYLTPYSWREEIGLSGPIDNGFYDVSNATFGNHYLLNPTKNIILPPIWISPRLK